MNDNGGKDFRFAEGKWSNGWAWGGLVSVDLAEDPVRAADLNLPAIVEGTEEQVALGATYVTDVLLVSLTTQPSGISLDPFSAARQAAWYSLGFLLREAAVRTLDVQSQELRVGLRVARPGGSVTTELFLADSLENGAGYCTHLGSTEQFSHVLAEAATFVAELETGTHASRCDSSCYDCLRDYYNMAYHPLLDWRLARDMQGLLEKSEFDTSLWEDEETDLAASFSADFGGAPLQLDGGVWAVDLPSPQPLVILSHPLENTLNEDVVPERLALAIGDAEMRGLAGDDRPITFADTFNLIRRPGWVAADV